MVEDEQKERKRRNGEGHSFPTSPGHWGGAPEGGISQLLVATPGGQGAGPTP